MLSEEGLYLQGVAVGIMFAAKEDEIRRANPGISEQDLNKQLIAAVRKTPEGGRSAFSNHRLDEWSQGIPDDAIEPLKQARAYLKDHGIAEPKMDDGRTLEQLEQEAKDASKAKTAPAPHPAPEAPAISTPEPEEKEKEKKAALPPGALSTPVAAYVAGGGETPLEKAKDGNYPKDKGTVERVTKAQECLKAMGIDCGSVDGKFGPKTEAAVKAFEERMGIKPADGKLSKQEMDLLQKEAARAAGIDKGKGHETPVAAPAPAAQQQRRDTVIGADDIKASLEKSHVDVLAFKEKLAQRTGIAQSAGTDVDAAMVAAVNKAVVMDRSVNFAKGAMAQADHDARGAETGGMMIDRMDRNMNKALQQAYGAGATRQARDDGGFGVGEVADGIKQARTVVAQVSRAAKQIGGMLG